MWYRVIGDTNHNDTAPPSVVVHWKETADDYQGNGCVKAYDGTKNADISSVTFDNVDLEPRHRLHRRASFGDAGGQQQEHSATVTLMEQAAKNYALEQSSYTTGSIAPRRCA